MRLLERDAPLTELRRLHVEAVADGGRLVFLEGEAGIGKTSLLAAFRDGLSDGTTCLLGACDPLSTPRPLGPFVDVADGLDPDLERQLLRDPRSDRLPALLAALRAKPGLVLFIDDLHWADEATLDAVRFIGRRIGTTRVLVIGTYRDDEVGSDHPLRTVVGDLATSPSVRRVPLRPLTADAVADLVAGSGLDPRALHEQTGGNPFYVTEILAGAPTGAQARVPATVRDAVLARAARLTPAARRTLEAAAAVGPVISPGLLIRVVEPVAAQECLDRGLLVSRDGQYAFRHAIAREAILSATDPSTRIGLHARILAGLGRDPAGSHPLALLAHHADGAGDREAVWRYAPAAARQAAAASANREAAAQFARAVGAAGGRPEAERAALLGEYADAQAAVGREDVALTAHAEAATIWHRLGEPLRESLPRCRMATACVSLGRNAEAEAASRRALDLTAAAPDSTERVEALMTQAYLRMLDRDNQEAIDLGRQVLARGPGAVPPRTYASALNLVGSARILLDDPEGRDDLLQAIAIFERERIPWGVRSCYGNLGSSFGEMYHFADAEPYLDAAVRVADEHDIDASYPAAWRVLVRMDRGRWAAAESEAAALVRQEHGPPISRLMALVALGRLKARRGDADAWGVLDEALAVAAPTGTLQRLGPVRAARAEAAWLQGDPDGAAEEAAAAVDLAVQKGHPWHIGELGWWISQAGRPAPLGPAAAEPWRHQLSGRWREAADAWRARECPYEAARAVLAGDDAAAIDAAYRELDELGAAPAAALAARRLRELGAPSIPRGRRASTRRNPAGLTERELEILRLVADGLPNARIADRLVLSPRTVDHHVSAVLGKLGIARRGEAAAAAERLGIDLQDGWSPDPR